MDSDNNTVKETIHKYHTSYYTCCETSQ